MHVAPVHLALAALLLGLVLASLAIHIWSRRALPTTGPLALALAGLALWLLGQSLRFAVDGLEDKILATRLVYAGIALFPTSLLVLALRTAGKEQWTRPPQLALLAAEPLLSLIAAVTPELQHLLWSDAWLVEAGGAQWLRLERGSAFWIHAGYSHALVGISCALILWRYLRDPGRRPLELGIAAAGIAVPWLINVAYLAGAELVAHTDVTVYGFAVTGCAFGWLTLRGHLLDPIPFARSRVMDALEEGHLVVDVHGHALDANPAFLAAIGLERLPADRRLHRVLAEHPELRELAAAGPPLRRDVDLGPRRYELQISELRSGPGKLAGHILVLRDVSMARAIERELRASEARHRTLVDHASAGIFELDARARIRFVNPAGERLLGQQRSELLGRDFPERVHPEDRGRFQADLRLGASGELRRLSARLGHADGHATWCSLSLRGMEGGAIQVLAHDESEQRAAEERIRRLAYYDSLTGLPNRQLFARQLERALSLARMRERRLAVLFLDLDGFKEVNDSLGHSAGDELLSQVSTRFLEVVRTGDVLARAEGGYLPDGLEISRLGGDEFTLLVPGLEDARHAALVADRIHGALAQPVRVRGQEVLVRASVGISIFPEDGEDAETLLRNADSAMYEAKRDGPGQIRFYDPGMNAHGARRLQLESELQHAISRGELSLRYQPLHDAAGGRLTAVEALLRWESPSLGPVAPDEFIPVAERSGLIVPIGEWVLRRACREIAALEAQGLRRPRLAVNVAARQLEHPDFAALVERVVEETGVGAGALELEITEGALWRRTEAVTRNLARIDELGVGLALDDFGVGHSSLSRLRELPIGRVKIDRDFVSGVPGEDEGRFASAVIAMAHHLGIPVVAEGVEREEQAVFLRERECDELQGYLLGRPMRIDALARRLERRKPPEALGGLGAAGEARADGPGVRGAS